MKLKGITKVLVPWFDDKGMKQWQLMRFQGELDRRAMLRHVTKYIKNAFGTQVSSLWVMQNCAIVNEADIALPLAHTEAYTQAMEDFISRMKGTEDEENEGEGSTSAEETGTGRAGMDMPHVQLELDLDNDGQHLSRPLPCEGIHTERAVQEL